jgi:hypothetical protein
MATGIHERLAVVLLNELLSEPTAAENRIFCKLLNLLYIDGAAADDDAIQTLHVLTSNALEAVENKLGQSALLKFQGDLAAMRPADAESGPGHSEAVLARTLSHTGRRGNEITEALSDANESSQRDSTSSKRRGSKPKGRARSKVAEADDDGTSAPSGRSSSAASAEAAHADGNVEEDEGNEQGQDNDDEAQEEEEVDEEEEEEEEGQTGPE